MPYHDACTLREYLVLLQKLLWNGSAWRSLKGQPCSLHTGTHLVLDVHGYAAGVPM